MIVGSQHRVAHRKFSAIRPAVFVPIGFNQSERNRILLENFSRFQTLRFRRLHDIRNARHHPRRQRLETQLLRQKRDPVAARFGVQGVRRFV